MQPRLDEFVVQFRWADGQDVWRGVGRGEPVREEVDGDKHEGGVRTEAEHARELTGMGGSAGGREEAPGEA